MVEDSLTPTKHQLGVGVKSCMLVLGLPKRRLMRILGDTPGRPLTGQDSAAIVLPHDFLCQLCAGFSGRAKRPG